MKLPRPKLPKFAAGRKKQYVESVKSVSDIFGEISKKIKKDRFAMLGIGNDLKGDDAAGWLVADLLKEQIGNDGNFLCVKTAVPENHVKEIADFLPDLLIIADAADFHRAPGTVKFIHEHQISDTLVSTHTTPLTLFLRLYQADQVVKRRVTIIGIQKKSSEFGQHVSEPVRQASGRVAKMIAGLYKKGMLGASLERELNHVSNPFKKVADRLKKK